MLVFGLWFLGQNGVFRSCPQFRRGCRKGETCQKPIVPTAPASLLGDAVQNRCSLLQDGGRERREGQVRGGAGGWGQGKGKQTVTAAWKVLKNRQDGGRAQRDPAQWHPWSGGNLQLLVPRPVPPGEAFDSHTENSPSFKGFVWLNPHLQTRCSHNLYFYMRRGWALCPNHRP